MINRNLLITILILLLAIVVMGLYGLHLRNRALSLEQQVTDRRPVAPPAVGPEGKVLVFTPIDERGTLVRLEINGSLPTEASLRAREIVHLLITEWQRQNSTHPIGGDADVSEVFLLNNNRSAIVDVNAAFANQHRSGIMVEELTMASIARSLGANIPGLEEIKIIVEGHERDTLAGHADLSDFYGTNSDWPVEQ